ncbi:MAG: hypothetical protein LBH18_05880 [Spirochaetaceae bacterium]|jgi:hypothetical protein|nr:hypothetical protein [Spirochaetaceae bacterium]
MVDTNEWYALFKQAREKKQEWLSRVRIPELKTKFSEFRKTFAILYFVLLQKNYIMKDPYKSETPVGDLKVPETRSFFEPKKREEFSLRLAKYDNQLEYIVTFYDFSVDTLKPDKIRIMRAIIWFIEWQNLSLTSPSLNTQAMAEIFFNLRNRAVNKILLKNLETCFDDLYTVATYMDKILNEINEYQREAYKGNIRSSIIANMDGIATIDSIKKKFYPLFPEEIFYPEIVQELLDEDNSPDANVREDILKKLNVTEYAKPIFEETVSLKPTLIEGLNALCSTVSTFREIIVKIEHNHGVYRRKNRSIRKAIVTLFKILFKKKQTADFYECEIAGSFSSRVKIINHYLLVKKLNEKIKELRTITGSTTKLEKMDEEELLNYLSRNIRDIQKHHRLLAALDKFFRTKITNKQKNHIKGMRPELTTIKNALSKAVVKYEYYLVTRKS